MASSVPAPAASRASRRSVVRYTRISADSHIDLPWLPADLFTSGESPAMKDRMPYVAEGPDGLYWTARNGRSFGLVGGVGPSGQRYITGPSRRSGNLDG